MRQMLVMMPSHPTWGNVWYCLEVGDGIVDVVAVGIEFGTVDAAAENDVAAAP